jgi:chromosome segregation ATPase
VEGSEKEAISMTDVDEFSTDPEDDARPTFDAPDPWRVLRKIEEHAPDYLLQQLREATRGGLVELLERLELEEAAKEQTKEALDEATKRAKELQEERDALERKCHAIEAREGARKAENARLRKKADDLRDELNELRDEVYGGDEDG